MTEIDNNPNEAPICCVRCQQIKPAESFKPRSRNPEMRDTHCRPCRAAYQHEHYLKNRQRYIASAGERRRTATVERMSHLIRFFEAHPCVDCGESDPNVLEFDHLGDKSFNISQGFRDRPWNQVLAEIEKCEVRCANCHRRRTAVTLGWFRAIRLDDSLEVYSDPEPSDAR